MQFRLDGHEPVVFGHPFAPGGRAGLQEIRAHGHRQIGDEIRILSLIHISSTPELGVNAAGMLLMLLADVNAGGGSKKAIRALAEKIGLEYDGKTLGIACADEESGALTCNLGILRFDGKNISAQLDIRYPLCADEEKSCGQAAMALSDTGLSVRREGGHTPHYVSKEHKVVKGLVKVYSEVTGTMCIRDRVWMISSTL